MTPVRTVLVVDDEPDVRLIARMVLVADGFDVREVGSGEAAFEDLAQSGAPDLVLLDVRLPGIDGWEVLRRLRADPAMAGVPVVVFTADLGARSEAPVHLEDTEILITKPFQADDLLAAVRTATGAGA
jgi:CheY-like chemotaxis protein